MLMINIVILRKFDKNAVKQAKNWKNFIRMGCIIVTMDDTVGWIILLLTVTQGVSIISLLKRFIQTISIKVKFKYINIVCVMCALFVAIFLVLFCNLQT